MKTGNSWQQTPGSFLAIAGTFTQERVNIVSPAVNVCRYSLWWSWSCWRLEVTRLSLLLTTFLWSWQKLESTLSAMLITAMVAEVATERILESEERTGSRKQFPLEAVHLMSAELSVIF